MSQQVNLLPTPSAWRVTPLKALSLALPDIQKKYGGDLHLQYGWLFRPVSTRIEHLTVVICCVNSRRPRDEIVVFFDPGTGETMCPERSLGDFARLCRALDLRSVRDRTLLYRYAHGCYGELWKATPPVELASEADCDRHGVPRSVLGAVPSQFSSVWWQLYGGEAFCVNVCAQELAYHTILVDCGNYRHLPVVL